MEPINDPMVSELRAHVGPDRELLFDRPKFTRPAILEALTELGVEVNRLDVRGDEFQSYLAATVSANLYPERYQAEFGSYFRRKALEHFISFQILQFDAGDVYMDVASSGSPVPEIVAERFNLAHCWRQDLQYKPGVWGNRIGSNGAAIPLEDASVTKMALHCSIEHFEQDSDTLFVREAVRLLEPGGTLCSIPLYMSDVAHILTNCDLLRRRGFPDFEPATPLYLSPEPSNHHGRFYTPETFVERVADPVKSCDARCVVFDIQRHDLDLGVGTDLAFAIRKPLAATDPPDRIPRKKRGLLARLGFGRG